MRAYTEFRQRVEKVIKTRRDSKIKPKARSKIVDIHFIVQSLSQIPPFFVYRIKQAKSIKYYKPNVTMSSLVIVTRVSSYRHIFLISVPSADQWQRGGARRLSYSISWQLLLRSQHFPGSGFGDYILHDGVRHKPNCQVGNR